MCAQCKSAARLSHGMALTLPLLLSWLRRALGLMNIFARVGGMVAPQIAGLSSTWSALPSLIFATLAFLGVAALLAMPETQGAMMSESLARAPRCAPPAK